MEYGISVKHAQPIVIATFECLGQQMTRKNQFEKLERPGVERHDVKAEAGQMFYHADGIVSVCVYNDLGQTALYLKWVDGKVVREENDV